MSFYYTSLYARLFPSILWHGTGPAVHLTYDDGPHPTATPAVLDILKARNLRAVFFLTGSRAGRYPEIVLRIRDEGHGIGNHAYDHRLLLARSAAAIREQVQKGGDAIAAVTGTAPAMFRPPYGLCDWRTLRIARELGCRFTMFSLDTNDYGYRSALRTALRVERRARPGDILLFHDNDLTASSAAETAQRTADVLERMHLTCSLLTA